MRFDRYSIVLLRARPDAPHLTEAETAALQDAHMAYLAELHDAGQLLVAGPLAGDEFRGLSIMRVEPEEARTLCEQDPAVLAGEYSIVVIPWRVPGGAMSFPPAFFPRSMAEASRD